MNVQMHEVFVHKYCLWSLHTQVVKGRCRPRWLNIAIVLLSKSKFNILYIDGSWQYICMYL